MSTAINRSARGLCETKTTSPVDDSHFLDERRLMNHELWDDDSGKPSPYFARSVSHNCGGLQNYC